MATGLLDIKHSLLLRLDDGQTLRRSLDSRTYSSPHTPEACHCLWELGARMGPHVSIAYRVSMQPADAVESGAGQMLTGGESISIYRLAHRSLC